LTPEHVSRIGQLARNILEEEKAQGDLARS
jgi:hypothetical protein